LPSALESALILGMRISFRRSFLLLFCFFWTISLGSFSVAKDSAMDSASHKYLLFVGTYTEKESKGIYAYRFDATTAELTPLGVAAATTNPSFLTIDRRGHYLYAVNETQDYKGDDRKSGRVSAFSINRQTGKLSLLNEVSSRGADPCYIAFDRTGKYVLVANYTGGNVAVFPIEADGRLGEATSAVADSGALGPNKERQDAPHSHWIEPSVDNHFAYVADLGLDRVLAYRFDSSKGTLTKAGDSGSKPSSPVSDAGDSFSATLAPGSGPRHVASSGSGHFMYVLGELDSTVTVFANDAGKPRSVQRISALPAKFSGTNTAAEIAIHPNGKYLYTSNRGNDSIAAFSINRGEGTLTLVDRFSTQGPSPRNFEIDPSGKFLLVANQDSNSIVVFRIDPGTGRLTPTGQSIHVPAPVCLKFMDAE
jgi:6-phosphogluconolactonase